MPDQPEDDTLSIQIANQIINVANTRTQEGVGADDVARGLRHAAANFSAFAEHQRRDGDIEPDSIVEEFARFLEYYLGRHGANDRRSVETGDGPTAGLVHLVEQVKKEL